MTLGRLFTVVAGIFVAFFVWPFFGIFGIVGAVPFALEVGMA